MSTDTTEAIPTLLPVDRPRHHARQSSRQRFAPRLPFTGTVDPLAAVSALVALIARYARVEDVTVFLTTRALAALDAISDCFAHRGAPWSSILFPCPPSANPVPNS